MAAINLVAYINYVYNASRGIRPLMSAYIMLEEVDLAQIMILLSFSLM